MLSLRYNTSYYQYISHRYRIRYILKNCFSSSLVHGIVQATSRSESESSEQTRGVGGAGGARPGGECAGESTGRASRDARPQARSSCSLRNRSCSSRFCLRHFARRFLNHTFKEKRYLCKLIIYRYVIIHPIPRSRSYYLVGPKLQP